MKKIIIIEDDPIVARIYQNRLEKEGWEVETATDGQSGYYRIHEYKPNAVLLDLMLPKMNGVDVLKKIRSESEFQKLPIIVFTNAYVPNMIQEAFQAGASQVFNKATLTPRQVIDALQTSMYLSSGEVPVKGSGARPGPATGSQSGTGQHPDAAKAPTEAPTPGNPAGQPFPGSGTRSQAPMPDQGAMRFDPEEDQDFRAEAQETFQETAPETLAAIRRSMQELSKLKDDNARIPHLLELYRRVHSLTGSAGIAGLRGISQVAAALEVLLKELHEKPKNFNASSMRTVAHAIDFIIEMFTRGTSNFVLPGDPFNILVVDDEILSRRAITYALEKAGLKSVSVEDPQMALNLASEKPFDLIFLDVQMPGMDGFDLCTKVREISFNSTTPIIFVTSLTDFKSRARSSLSGGTDLIAKPFMFMELSVKALTYVLRGRINRNGGANVPSMKSAA